MSITPSRQEVWRTEFENLVKENHAQLVRHATQLAYATDASQSAEDILQTALVEMYRRFPLLSPMWPGEFLRYSRLAMKKAAFSANLRSVSLQQLELDPVDTSWHHAQSEDLKSFNPALTAALDSLSAEDRYLILTTADNGPQATACLLGLSYLEFEQRLAIVRQSFEQLLASPKSKEGSRSSPSRPVEPPADPQDCKHTVTEIARAVGRSNSWVDRRLKNCQPEIRIGPLMLPVRYYDKSELQRLSRLAQTEKPHGAAPLADDQQWWQQWEIQNRLGKAAGWCRPRLLPHRQSPLSRRRQLANGRSVWEYHIELVQRLEVDMLQGNQHDPPPGWQTATSLRRYLKRDTVWMNAHLLPAHEKAAREFQVPGVPGRAVKRWRKYYPPWVASELLYTRDLIVAQRVARQSDSLYYWRDSNYPEVLAWKKAKNRLSPTTHRP